MTTNQGLRHQSIRDVTGTAGTYNEDWCALFTLLGQTATDINGGMVEFLQAMTGLSILDINGLQSAYAAINGFDHWDAVTFISPVLALTGLIGWWDFADPNSVTIDTGISQVNDKSGNGHHFVQATGSAQPVYISAGQAGLNTADFNGSSHVMTLSSPTWNVGVGGYYIAAALEWDKVTGSQVFIGKTGSNWAHYINGTTPTVWDGVTVKSFASLVAAINTPSLIEFWRDGTDLRCRLNGVLDSDELTLSTNIGGNDNLGLGRDSGTNWTDGEIMECVFCDDLPSAALRNAILAAWPSKWGINVS